MRLLPNSIWMINLFALISLCFWVFISYKLKGKKIIVMTGYGVIVLTVSWFLSWILASLMTLVPTGTTSKLLATTIWLGIINQLLWFGLVLIMMIIIAIMIQFKLFIAGPRHLSKPFDIIISSLFSLTMTLSTWMIVSLILASPLFINGRALLEQSWLRHMVAFGVEIMGEKVALFYQDDLIQKILDDQPLSQDDKVRLQQSLQTVGLSLEVSQAITKIIIQESLDDQEIITVKNYIIEAKLTDEEVVSVLDQIRLPEEKIIEYMEKLDYSQETIQRLLDKKRD